MKRVEHTLAFELEQPAAVLFPLFSAEGETKWVPGWTYRNVMGGTDLHEDYVFTTSSHDHAAGEAIWLVKRFEPARYRVAFYKVEPGEKVGVITVQCTALSATRTRVQVTYAYQALSARGEAFIEGFTAAEYARFIGEWERLLKEYFAREGAQ